MKLLNVQVLPDTAPSIAGFRNVLAILETNVSPRPLDLAHRAALRLATPIDALALSPSNRSRQAGQGVYAQSLAQCYSACDTANRGNARAAQQCKSMCR